MRILLHLLLCTVLCPQIISAQQTVGIFRNSQAAFNGYTLFGPMTGKETFLINNCGELVHKWTSQYRPGVMPYLLENGTLLRPAVVDNLSFLTGGSGGLIQLLDWDGKVIWQYRISSNTQCQHHDVQPLPNGNILAIVWDAIPGDVAFEAGRGLVSDRLWSEKIVEIEPDLVNGTGRIVWEWRLWDHIVQNHRDDVPTYGVPSQHPRKVDLNYTPFNAGHPDWLHINSIDYNPELDQILLSVNFLHEVWIIDHSTTTEEAKTDKGGRYGHGGELLFRWGNPAAYGQGEKQHQRLSRQHDARWITVPGPDSGMIMVFNNMAGDLVDSKFSTVNIFDPGVLPDGSYQLKDGRFGPDDFVWTYKAPTPADMKSDFISGAKKLPNGNVLICVGDVGRFFEVTRNGEVVWEYINPASTDGMITQGQKPANNMVFRIDRLEPDHPAFAGRTLIPQGYLEPGSTFDCELHVVSVEEDHHGRTSFIDTYPNPAQSFIVVRSESTLRSLRLVDQVGRTVLETVIAAQGEPINVDALPDGPYLVVCTTTAGAIEARSIVIQR